MTSQMFYDLRKRLEERNQKRLNDIMNGMWWKWPLFVCVAMVWPALYLCSVVEDILLG